MKALGKVKWNLQDVFNVFVVTFGLELILFFAIHFLGIGAFIESISSNVILKGLLILFIYLLQILGMLFPLWFFIIRRYKSEIREFGFHWIGLKKTILWILGSYIFYIGLGILIIMIFFSLGIDKFGFEPQRSIFEIFGRDPFGIMVAIFVAIIIAPFVEELFFRGFMLQTLAKRISPFWGVLLTALIFAAVHFEFQSIMPLLILSFILNILYIRTRSIWPGIIFHMFNNSVSFIAIYFLESYYFL